MPFATTKNERVILALVGGLLVIWLIGLAIS
jgi:hypothetical protein